MRYARVNKEELSALENINDMEPMVIDYQIDGFTEVCPKLEYNKPIYSPMPLLPEGEYLPIIHKFC